jgi:hypothetical protein
LFAACLAAGHVEGLTHMRVQCNPLHTVNECDIVLGIEGAAVSPLITFCATSQAVQREQLATAPAQHNRRPHATHLLPYTLLLGHHCRHPIHAMPAAADPSQPSARASTSKRSSSYFTYPVSYAMSGILRRLNTDTGPDTASSSTPDNQNKRQSQLAATATSLSNSFANLVSGSSLSSSTDNMDSVFRPSHRMASPFQPPPLTPLTLTGYRGGMRESGKLLNKALAEEIRLLLPPRLQLVDDWSLLYSLEQNGVSLATLYKQADDYRGVRGGFVLVVKDSGGGVRGHALETPKKDANIR